MRMPLQAGSFKAECSKVYHIAMRSVKAVAMA